MTPTSRTRPDLEESDGEGGIVLGAALGLVVALVFGAMLAIEGPAPRRAEQFAGTVMFGLLLATGPLVGLASLITGSRGRGPMLLGAAALAFASVGVSWAGVGIVFLPSAALFLIGAIRAVRRAGWAHGMTPALAVVSLGIVMLFPYPFVQLIAAVEDGRCWEVTRFEDGRVEVDYWRSPDISSGHASGSSTTGPTGPGVVQEEGGCTSDVTTLADAARSVIPWALGMTGYAGIWTMGRVARMERRPSLDNES